MMISSVFIMIPMIPPISFLINSLIGLFADLGEAISRAAVSLWESCAEIWSRKDHREHSSQCRSGGL